MCDVMDIVLHQAENIHSVGGGLDDMTGSLELLGGRS